MDTILYKCNIIDLQIISSSLVVGMSDCISRRISLVTPLLNGDSNLNKTFA